MHDPLVVAFDIPRPWPKRDRMYDSIDPERPNRVAPRWRFKHHHDCSQCDEVERAEHAGKRHFPWWKPSSWTPSWTIAGRGFYWPSMITIWHREPGGHDSGEICKHYRRTQQPDGTWKSKYLNGWKFHVHHWSIQVSPLQDLRRWLLTRCAWCGGKSRKGDYVNFSHGWDTPPGKWWQGAPDRFHHDCSSIETAHRSCTCDIPDNLSHGNYGECSTCGKFRAYATKPVTIEAHRLLQAIPAGQRNPEIFKRVEALWAAHREREEVTDG